MSDRDIGGFQIWTSKHIPEGQGLALNEKALRDSMNKLGGAFTMDRLVLSPGAFFRFNDILAFERAAATTGQTGPFAPLTWKLVRENLSSLIWRGRYRLARWIGGSGYE